MGGERLQNIIWLRSVKCIIGNLIILLLLAENILLRNGPIEALILVHEQINFCVVFADEFAEAREF